MRNVIQLVNKYIMTRIPKEVLNEAFRPHQEGRTLDALIKEKVIIDMVLSQANLYTGKVTKIVMNSSFLKEINVMDDTQVRFMTGQAAVYQIPPEYRENRAISLVLDLSYPHQIAYAHGTDISGFTAARSLANRADEMLTSFTMSPNNITPTPILVDGQSGIVRLEPPISMHSDWILACCLEFDNNLTGMSKNMIPHLQKLCLIATKMYIYNDLFIKINMGQLVSGSALEAIRSIVEEYRDKDQEYEEALLKFRGASIFSSDHLGDYLSLMIGS